MTTYKIPTDIKITDTQIDDVLDSALNWCGYWCEVLSIGVEPTEEVKYTSETITRGGTLLFTIDEPFKEGGKTEFELTLDKMLEGIAKYGEYDLDQFDGPMADAAIQTALFGEVIYG